MKVAVTGATGNIGSSLVEAAAHRDEVERVIGIARRRPAWDPAKTTWVEADILEHDLATVFDGADALVHLAWAIQPSHDRSLMERTNVAGSARVFEAARQAGVGKIVYASSVGAYASGPSDRRVDEDWPLEPIGESTYAADKVAVERELDRFEADNPGIAVVRMRPGLIFKADAASEIRRLFAGPFLPGSLVAPGRLPVLPLPAGLRFQAVHSCDVGEAFLDALARDVAGPFNLAADPPIGAEEIGRVLEAPTVDVPPGAVRGLAGLSWRARIQPSEPGWIDLAMDSPLMSTERARQELAWRPRFTALEALAELIEGLRTGKGHSAPHLASSRPAGRIDELRTGVGGRQWVARRAEQIRKYLADAHSIEKQALVQMRYAPGLAAEPSLAGIFRDHRAETVEHEEAVRSRLAELGTGPVPVKDAAGTAGGLGMLLFARTQPDTPGKLVAHGYSYEHMEAAAYGILAAIAERSGDADTAAMARSIGDQEQAMAARLRSAFPRAVQVAIGRTAKEAPDLLPQYLADAHALQSQAITFYRAAPRLVDDPGLAEIFRQCGQSAAANRLAIERCLAALDAEPSVLKTSPMLLGGHTVARAMGVQPDPATKLAGYAFAFEHLRVAATSMLGEVGKLAGTPEVVQLASVGEDTHEALAGRIAGAWERLGGV